MFSFRKVLHGMYRKMHLLNRSVHFIVVNRYSSIVPVSYIGSVSYIVPVSYIQPLVLAVLEQRAGHLQ